MKRIAFLSLLLVPSVAGAQQSDRVQPAPYPPVHSVVVGNAVDQGQGQYDQRSALSQPCDTGCAPSCRPVCAPTSGWFGDVGFYVLRPQWSGGNPAFAFDTFAPGTTDSVAPSQQVEFDHDYDFAPLVQIGYAGRNGLGVRGRWWTLRSTEGLDAAFAADAAFDVAFRSPSLLGNGGEAFAGMTGAGDFDVEGSFRNRLDLDVIDLESIWDTSVGRSSLLLSAGVRYAHIGQTYDASVSQTSTSVNPADTFDAELRARNSFSGVGPTAALQAYRMIGQTNLSVYGLSRGSLLFGESRQRAFRTDSLGTDTSAALNSESIRPVMELEVGTNWTRNRGSYDVFLESGLVGMVWFNAGNAANSDSILAGNVGTDNANQDLGLLGLRFSTGVRF